MRPNVDHPVRYRRDRLQAVAQFVQRSRGAVCIGRILELCRGVPVVLDLRYYPAGLFIYCVMFSIENCRL